jgi:hypothetical protein
MKIWGKIQKRKKLPPDLNSLCKITTESGKRSDHEQCLPAINKIPFKPVNHRDKSGLGNQHGRAVQAGQQILTRKIIAGAD